MPEWEKKAQIPQILERNEQARFDYAYMRIALDISLRQTMHLSLIWSTFIMTSMKSNVKVRCVS